jgi:hypothetical protein
MTLFETAMLKPSDCFRQPRDVLAEPWTRNRKFQVLRQWEYDLGQLDVATDENMPPPPPSLAHREVSLGAIHDAMAELGYAPESTPAPSKGG